MRQRKSRQKRSQVYDSSLKEMVQQQPETIIPQLLAGAIYVETLDVERIRPTLRVDRVYKIIYHGEEHILHLEFESKANSDMPVRLLVYHGILYKDYHLPVISVIVYPFPVVMAESPLKEMSGDRALITFEFQVLPLFELDAEYYMQEHITCMYALLPAMRNVTADLVKQAMDELSELYDGNEYTLSQLFVWMELLLQRNNTMPRREREEVQAFLRTYDPLWEQHPKVKQIKAEARTMVKEARAQLAQEAKAMRAQLAQEAKATRAQLAEELARIVQEREQAQVRLAQEREQAQVRLAQEQEQAQVRLAQEREQARIEARLEAERLAEQQALQLKRDDILTIIKVHFPALTELAQERVAAIQNLEILKFLFEQIAMTSDEVLVRALPRPPVV